MNKEYNKNDKVWVAKLGNFLVREECPCCFTTRKVTLILGNGEQLSLACDYCSVGYEPPTGYVESYQKIAEVQQQTIISKSVVQVDDVRECSYRTDGEGMYYSNDVFDTKEEAEQHLKIKIEEYEKSECQRKKHRKQDINKKYSWSAGYHLTAAKKAEKEMLYHRGKYQYLKKQKIIL